MKVIKDGMEKLSSSQLEQFYVENRFTNYSIRTTGYENIMPSAKNTIMPAFDGEKWVYLDEDGRDKLIGEFDTVLPFNTNGYAVVSVDGKYMTICSNGDLYGIDETGIEDAYYMTSSGVIAKHGGKYGYYNYDFESTSTIEYDEITAIGSGVIVVKNGSAWGILDSSGKIVGDFSYSDAAVNSLGSVFCGKRGMMKNSSGWQLVDTDGNVFASNVFYDAKAPESENGYIAVTNEKGKWGFIDLDGNLVIDYKYDVAKSFSNGLAAVCMGERWQYIDDRDNTVIDIDMEYAEPFHNGVAQVGMVDGTAILKLKYFEE
jgi:hypothetical protein